ncbi:MAG: PilZ domain-containing protein [Gammaproteobacteria bacterium]
MQFNPTVRLSRFIGTREGRRIPGRLPQEQLICSLGPVLDLSPGGMRVLCTRPRLGTTDIDIRGGDYSLKLRTKVAWSRRLGFRRHEIGLTFLDVDEELATVLSRISSDHRARRQTL